MASEEEIFANPTIVSSRSFTFFEGWTNDQRQLQTRAGRVPFNELHHFLNCSHNYALPQDLAPTDRFRVISFPRLEHSRLKLGFPRETYQQFKQSWQLHEFAIEAFLNNNGVLSEFKTQHMIFILMKVAASQSIGFDAVSVAYDRDKRITNVLYYSLGDEASIFHTLQASPERCLQPAFFAAVLYRCHQQRVERHQKKVDDQINHTERGTRFGGSGRLFGRLYNYEELAVETTSDSVTKKLSYCQTELAVIGHAARSSLDCGNWLVQILEKDRDEWKMFSETVDTRGNEAKMGQREEHLKNIMLDITAKTFDEAEYTRRRATMVLSQLQQLKDRVHSQTTFILSTTAQNQAEYTASIAVESKRDSTAMKTIAVLTTFFLPGTFVATFFSMTMFDWKPSDGTPPQVSKYIWVYWLITIPLTLLVMASWLFWSRRDHLRSLNSVEKNTVNLS